MAFRFGLVTLFPDYFEAPLKSSLLGKALEDRTIEVARRDGAHAARRERLRVRHRDPVRSPLPSVPGRRSSPSTLGSES